MYLERNMRLGIRDTSCKMRCPFCKEDHDKVIDSRSSDAGRVIRRRRQCLACKRRFTTYEKAGESFKLNVVKKDNSRVPYDREKIIAGIQKSCYKRAISAEQIQNMADKVEEKIFQKYDKEVKSSFIGESVMNQLRKIDKVAYIRFASIYREFTDITTLKRAVDSLVGGDIGEPVPDGQLPLLPDEELAAVARGRRKGRK